ncbi:MAG: hypothetical protein EOO38_19400 [Cytophagaceae bacterium]|nr:MAG: hypothetical protein EOO38_19400 [Cytophagaceae bacterium]
MGDMVLHYAYNHCGTRVVEVHFDGHDWVQQYRGESGIRDAQDDIALLQEAIEYIKTGEGF